jgi:hypothetical protein
MEAAALGYIKRRGRAVNPPSEGELELARYVLILVSLLKTCENCGWPQLTSTGLQGKGKTS